MNVFGQRERSWRKARKRAVSPIIATILLVAITVVLAAVLYVLITGLTHGPGSTPIGSAFTAGNPIGSTNTGAAAAASCTGVTGATAVLLTSIDGAGNDYYTLTVESSTITMSSALFEVKTSTGAIYSATGATEGGAFFIVNVAGDVVACQTVAAAAGMAMTAPFSTFSGASNCNAAACTSSSPLTSIYTIVLVLGNPTTSPLGTSSLTFVAVGTGSFSGTTGGLTLP